MPTLIGDVITEARSYIQDTVEPYRYSDTDLVTYFNSALLETRRLRPDLFFADFDYEDPIPLYTVSDLGVTFPIDQMAILPMAYYIAGSAELRDDEHTVDNRAGALLRAFVDKLTKAA